MFTPVTLPATQSRITVIIPLTKFTPGMKLTKSPMIAMAYMFLDANNDGDYDWAFHCAQKQEFGD